MAMNNSGPPLRILLIIGLPWDPRLGAARVCIELVREWEGTGHQVTKYCLTDAFPQPAPSRLHTLVRQLLFPSKAAAFVRSNLGRFDVIDSLIGVLPYSKPSLQFGGLLVGRSVGLYRFYDQFMKQSHILWPDQPKGRWFGRLAHGFLAWRTRINSEKSVSVCDLLNVPNEDERNELDHDSQIRARIIVQSYGLTAEMRAALAGAAAPPAERLRRQTICFIGMWGLRKGSRDWPEIIRTIRKAHPATKFLFLGTMFDERVVRSELPGTEGISCHTTFNEADLPSLLAHCTLGLFPSYIEGFGLALLEQLAAGLPSIAYDVPGPHQILRPQRSRLLVPVGDIKALTERAAQILALTASEYESLSADCLAIARSYRWDEIAHETIQEYRAALDSLGSKPAVSIA